jgi:hypothetical protein
MSGWFWHRVYDSNWTRNDGMSTREGRSCSHLVEKWLTVTCLQQFSCVINKEMPVQEDGVVSTNQKAVVPVCHVTK